jgi:hypothetical protein
MGHGASRPVDTRTAGSEEPSALVFGSEEPLTGASEPWGTVRHDEWTPWQRARRATDRNRWLRRALDLGRSLAESLAQSAGSEEPLLVAADSEEPLAVAVGSQASLVSTAGPERPSTVTADSEEPLAVTIGFQASLVSATGPERPSTVTADSEVPMALTVGSQASLVSAAGPERPSTVTADSEVPMVWRPSRGAAPRRSKVSNGSEEPYPSHPSCGATSLALAVVRRPRRAVGLRRGLADTSRRNACLPGHPRRSCRAPPRWTGDPWHAAIPEGVAGPGTSGLLSTFRRAPKSVVTTVRRPDPASAPCSEKRGASTRPEDPRRALCPEGQWSCRGTGWSVGAMSSPRGGHRRTHRHRSVGGHG